MIKRVFNVGHLGSFKGNIGDLINHLSFRKWFENLIELEVKWNNFEIRDCYRGKAKLDPDFIKFANQQDLVVIGGGNFFELWPENSRNGTSIDLTYSNLKEIKCPIFFNALGVDAGQGIGKQAQTHFRDFMDALTMDSQFYVSVRNDGSFSQLQEMKVQTKNVRRIPDAAFFYESKEQKAPNLNIQVGLNIAFDMPEIRYQDKTGDNFLNSLSEIVKALVSYDQKLQIALLPHIYSDVIFISKLLSLLPDEIVREKVTVERYDPTSIGAIEIAEVYSRCNLVLAQRFHANIIPIALGVPVIGLNSYPQIAKLYQELDLLENCVDIGSDFFAFEVIEKSFDVFENPTAGVAKQNFVRDQIRQRSHVVHADLKSWILGHLQ